MAHGDRSVDVFVRKLRQKLERVSPDWRYIHTHFGIGYRFDAEAVDGAAAEDGAAAGAEPAGAPGAPGAPDAPDAPDAPTVSEPVHV
jgi:DNA-binding winged helix-turn-helix (wHTH) protein